MEYNANRLHGQCGIVNILPPSTNATGSSNLASDVVALKKYEFADVILTFSTHADAAILTLYKSSDLTTNSTQGIAFNYFYTTQASVDTFTTQYVATTSGITLGTVDNQIYHLEVNSEALSSQYPNFYFTLTESTGQTVSGVAILSGRRYVTQPMPTAIA